jgi:hypothetical protein
MSKYKVLEEASPSNNQSYKLLNLETNDEELWERFKIIRRFQIGTTIEIQEFNENYKITKI